MKLSGYLYVLVMLCLLPVGQSLAQAHGLRFFSHEVDQDRRTGLNLAPGKMICTGGEYTLSFELSYRPGQANYYGYVFRLTDTGGHSIDLICNSSTQTAQHFQLVINERFSNIKFSIPNTQLFNRWSKLQFKFDTHVGSVTLTNAGHVYTDRVPIAGRSCFRLLFGANNQKGFAVTDVPPMDVRHISITNTGDAMLNWPLDDADGDKATETLQANHGRVTNPNWIKRMHRDWEQVASLSVAGNAGVSFDGKKNIIYVTGTDSVFQYNVESKQVKVATYTTGAHPAMPGNQAVWAAARGEVLNYYPDQKAVAAFTPQSRRWDKQFIYPDTASDYWHTNKYYSVYDTSLYIFGGYGHFKYRNGICKYGFNSQEWEQLQPGGDFFTPRYLAALGAGNGGAYILGGFGSSQGRQELGARNLYDMMYYDVRKNTFKKLYEFSPGHDFALANAMVIDERNDTFYALTFESRKYRTHLQMIKGALHKPGYTEVGNRIPYLFHDIESFADLYYSPSLQRFFAVVLLSRDNQTSVKIYSLMALPLVSGGNQPEVSNIKQETWFTLGSILIGLLAMLVFLIVRLRKPGAATQLHDAFIDDALPPLSTRDDGLQQQRRAGSICLFGDFRIIDRDGLEITHLFTPLLKELFLVIFLHSARWGRTISSEKLRELLWFDKNEDSARNNRSVSIARLKSLLERLPNCHIIKQGGSWKIAIDTNSVYVDYIDYLEIIKDKHRPDRHRLNKLADIIQRGNFLTNAEYQWLDVFKTEISNEIIDSYLQYANQTQIEADPDFLIRLSSYITYFDSVNEEAMRIRCRALAYLGKHSLARQVYIDFKREYAGIYGVEFAADLQNVLSDQKV